MILGVGGERFPVLVTREESTLTSRGNPATLDLPLTREAALRWIRASESELPDLLVAAQNARDRFKPRVITYSRKVFIPLTNLCRDYCGYCTFRRDPGQLGAHTMTPEEVLAVARAGEKLGCTEALFSLGDKPELIFPEMRETLHNLGFRSTLHYLEAMCELILRETTLLPHPNPGLMSAEWISRLAAVSPSMGLMLETTNDALLAPGAAHDNAPDKIPARRLRTIEEAGKQGVPFTTGHSDRHRRIARGPRGCAARHPRSSSTLRTHSGSHHPELPRQARNSHAQPRPEPSRGEMLRTIAVARLLMPEVNIQAPPNLSDPDYEQLLDAGINDWGGVSPLTPDFINPGAALAASRPTQTAHASQGIRIAPAPAGVSGIHGQAMGKSALLDSKTPRSRGPRRPRSERRMIVVLTGGSGGAKFVDGLRRVVPPEDLTIIVNTGDDHDWWGLHISPDVDSITYVLAGMLSGERGWGVRGDTFYCLQAMKELGEPYWFSVGDRDLATHLLRTKLLSQGRTLAEATQMIAERLNLEVAHPAHEQHARGDAS